MPQAQQLANTLHARRAGHDPAGTHTTSVNNSIARFQATPSKKLSSDAPFGTVLLGATEATYNVHILLRRGGGGTKPEVPLRSRDKRTACLGASFHVKYMLRRTLGQVLQTLQANDRKHELCQYHTKDYNKGRRHILLRVVGFTCTPLRNLAP